MPTDIYNLSRTELHKLLTEMGQPEYRGSQIWSGLYRQLWESLDQFTTLPEDLRNRLKLSLVIGSLTEKRRQNSADGNTTKLLFSLPDGGAVETVLMRYQRRSSVCISSQVGCPLACAFCATGKMGFSRNLSAGEIVEQVLRSAREFSAQGRQLSNVVLMGMGEPLLNYDNVLEAVHRLHDPEGFNLGWRRFTLSTVGLAPEIEQLGLDCPQINLAVSLHAADDELRSSLVPINRKYSLSDVIQACDRYLELTNRRITIEWALIDGVNDSVDQAEKLACLIAGKLFHVNLIRLNPIEEYGGKSASASKADTFQNHLIAAGIPCTIRLRRGIDIQAGCGQLAYQPDP